MVLFALGLPSSSNVALALALGGMMLESSFDGDDDGDGQMSNFAE